MARTRRVKSEQKPTVDEMLEESRRVCRATKLRIMHLLREKMNPITADLRALAPAANASPMAPHTRAWALRLGEQMGHLYWVFTMVDGEETRYRDLDEEELCLAAGMGSVVTLLESFRFGPVPENSGSKLRELAAELERLVGGRDQDAGARMKPEGRPVGRPRKYDEQVLELANTAYEENLAGDHKNDSKGAWARVAELYLFPSGDAARKQVESWKQGRK